MLAQIVVAISIVIYLSVGLVYALSQAEKDDILPTIVFWAITWPVWVWFEFLFWISVRIRKWRRNDAR